MIYIKQANTEEFNLGPINTCDGQPADLSEASVRLIIKKSIEDDDMKNVALKSVDNPESNIILFQFTPGDTANIPVGEYRIAVKIFYTNGREVEIFNDKCIVEKGVFNA